MRTDAQLLDRYFKDYHPLTFPTTAGMKLPGLWKKSAASCQDAALAEGDRWLLSAVGVTAPAACVRQATHRFVDMDNGRLHLLRRLCGVPPVPYEYLIRIDKKYNLKAEELAPLTDAGLTRTEESRSCGRGRAGLERVRRSSVLAAWALTRSVSEPSVVRSGSRVVRQQR